MHSSKLIKILSTFSIEEWKGFNKYILGQVGPNAEVVSLFKHLYQLKGNLSSKKLELETAHRLFFPDISQKSFQNIMSRLTKIVQDYIRWVWLKSNEIDYDTTLLRAYNDRGLYHLFDLKADKVRTIINNLKSFQKLCSED